MQKRRMSSFVVQNETNEFMTIFSFFCAQSGQLSSFLETIKKTMDPSNPNISEMEKRIMLILSSRYSSIICNCKSAIASMQHIIANERDQNISAMAKEILFTSLSIIQMNSSITFNNRPQQHQKQYQPPPSLIPASNSASQQVRPSGLRRNSHHIRRGSMSNIILTKNNLSSEEDLSAIARDNHSSLDLSNSSNSSLLAEQSQNEDNDENYVVCRICDEKVPLDLIDEHMDSCLNAYTNTSIISNVEAQLKTIASNVQQEIMNIKWPGPSKIAIATMIPLLKIILLVDQFIQINVHFVDAPEELNQIISEINVVQKDANNSTILGVLKQIKPLLKKKLRSSKAIANAEIILSKTRLSGDGHSNFHTQVQISDFDFVKRISRGAYAKVFLARKKRTGDIFAIKVIPKSSLQKKNQVKRVLDEKNILLQFNNPYIVSFCMFYFFRKRMILNL